MNVVLEAQSVRSVLPSLGKLVHVDSLRDSVELLDIYDIERLLNVSVRKLAGKVYAVRSCSRHGVTPSLIYLALRYCPTYAYYVNSLTTLIVTREQLRLFALGVLAHSAYASALRRELKNSVVLPEVSIEGDVHGIPIRGRIDLIIHFLKRLRLERRGVIGLGGRIIIAEVKTSRSSSRRVLEASLAQACIYRRLLDLDADICSILLDDSYMGTIDWARIEELCRLLSRSRSPPEPMWGLDFCPRCPIALLGFCEFYKGSKSRVESRSKGYNLGTGEKHDGEASERGDRRGHVSGTEEVVSRPRHINVESSKDRGKTVRGSGTGSKRSKAHSPASDREG